MGLFHKQKVGGQRTVSRWHGESAANTSHECSGQSHNYFDRLWSNYI